jgi:dTDP-4-dehydrorhamnose 3,5-epimerase
LRLIETPIPGAFVIEIEYIEDDRGFFARTYCDDELRALLPHIAQSSISFNPQRGTLRGMHYQRAPHGEAKLVRCTRGAIYDVIIDLASARWFGVELRPDNQRMLYVPDGVAHGFETLEANTEVSYEISAKYHPEAADGVRWNDSAFGIRWPLEPSLLSERDRSWPDFTP